MQYPNGIRVVAHYLGSQPTIDQEYFQIRLIYLPPSKITLLAAQVLNDTIMHASLIEVDRVANLIQTIPDFYERIHTNPKYRDLIIFLWMIEYNITPLSHQDTIALATALSISTRELRNHMGIWSTEFSSNTWSTLERIPDGDFVAIDTSPTESWNSRSTTPCFAIALVPNHEDALNYTDILNEPHTWSNALRIY